MRTGLGVDPAHGAVVPPIYLSTNYTFEGPTSPRQRIPRRIVDTTVDRAASGTEPAA